MHTGTEIGALTVQAERAPRLLWAFDLVIYLEGGRQVRVRRVARRHAAVSLSFIPFTAAERAEVTAHCYEEGRREDYKSACVLLFLSMPT